MPSVKPQRVVGHAADLPATKEVNLTILDRIERIEDYINNYVPSLITRLIELENIVGVSHP